MSHTSRAKIIVPPEFVENGYAALTDLIVAYEGMNCICLISPVEMILVFIAEAYLGLL